MDFYFQGLAWFNKGITPRQSSELSGLDRAINADPVNVDSLVGSEART